MRRLNSALPTSGIGGSGGGGGSDKEAGSGFELSDEEEKRRRVGVMAGRDRIGREERRE